MSQIDDIIVKPRYNTVEKDDEDNDENNYFIKDGNKINTLYRNSGVNTLYRNKDEF